MTTTYDVIVIMTREPDGGPYALQDKQRELERYMYGRSFLLDGAGTEELGGVRMVRWIYLVETHYARAILDRLASGLYFGHVATAEERYSVGL